MLASPLITIVNSLLSAPTLHIPNQFQSFSSFDFTVQKNGTNQNPNQLKIVDFGSNLPIHPPSNTKQTPISLVGFRLTHHTRVADHLPAATKAPWPRFAAAVVIDGCHVAQMPLDPSSSLLPLTSPPIPPDRRPRRSWSLLPTLDELEGSRGRLMSSQWKMGANLQNDHANPLPSRAPKPGGRHVGVATLTKSAPVALWTCGARLN